MNTDSSRRDVQSFRDLIVWQRGIALVETVYQACGSFPKHELYGLVNQMQRCAVSVPTNIAEGSHRDSTKEFLHFISISLGSLAELETHFIIAQRLNYVDGTRSNTLLSEIDELGRMLRALQKSLKSRLLD